MKGNLFKFIIAGILLTSLSNAQSSFGKTELRKTYSIELPDDWQVRSDLIVDMVAAPKERVKTEHEAALPNIKVVVKDLPDGLDIDQLCDISQKQWAGQWKVESDKKVKSGKTPTRRLVLIQDLGILKTKVLKAFASANGKYYIVSCSDKLANFDKSLGQFEKMLDSIELKK